MILETRVGVLVDVETSVNIRYGYDIRGEVVGENGTAALAETAARSSCAARTRSACRVPEDWRERFIAAYDVEFQEWIDAVAAGRRPIGPSAWDGYAAQVVCDAGVNALYSGDRVEVDLGAKPALYS